MVSAKRGNPPLECNSTLTSATGEEMLTPNPTNECNSTLTSGTRGIYPHCYTLMLMSGVTGYEFATRRAPTAGSLSYSFQELNKSMVDNYLKPVFLQTPGHDLRLIGQ